MERLYFTRYISLGLLALLAVGCGRRSDQASPREFRLPDPSPTATAPSEPVAGGKTNATPAPARDLFGEVAPRARKAVVIVSVFDQTGHCRANSHGFFVRNDGRFVADRGVVAGGVNAVAKAANGAIYNVTGSLHESGDSVLLKAEASGVPFLEPKPGNKLNPGDRVAAVLSPVERAKRLLEETVITAHFTDAAGEWFDVNPALSGNASGAPVINARGDLVGVVILHDGAGVVRSVNAVADLVSQITPSMTASWQSFSTPAPSAAPSSTPAKSATPVKIPLRGSRIAYAPAPRYPVELRRSHFSVRGSGSFRVTFDAQGRAVNAQTIRSTGNQTLDESALQALRSWRAEPGATWSLNVPITFSP